MPRGALKQNAAGRMLKEQLRRIGWTIDGFLDRLAERGWSFDRSTFNNYCRAPIEAAKPKRHNSGFRGQPALVVDIVQMLVKSGPLKHRWSPTQALTFGILAEQSPALLVTFAAFFDDSAAFEQAYATVAKVSDKELHLFAEQALRELWPNLLPERSGLPPRSFVELPPVPRRLYGRDEQLRTIAYALKSTPTARLALVGLPGVGKTALAAEVALRYGSFFLGGVFWLAGDTLARLHAGMVKLGKYGLRLGPFFDALPEPEQLRTVRLALERATHCLLIIDNLDASALDALDLLLPQAGLCRTLMTSRYSTPRAGGWLELALAPLASADSVDLLLQLGETLEAERPLLETSAAAVAQRFGELPLALTLAAAALRNDRDQAQQVLERLLAAPTPESLEATIGYFLGQLTPRHAILGPARELLALAAVFAPGQLIERELLEAMAGAIQTERATIGPIPYFAEALRELRARSLLVANEAGLSTHRVIRSYVRANLELRPAVLRAAELLWRMLAEEAGEAPECVGPNTLLVAGVAEDAVTFAIPRAAELCYLLGWHFTRNSEHEAALHWSRSALELARGSSDTPQAVLAEAWCRLGFAHLFRNEHRAAREAFAAMGVLHAQIYPEDHLERLIGDLNIAQAAVVDADYAEGELRARTALRRLQTLARRRLPHERAPVTARITRALRILSMAAAEQGRYWRAYRYIRLAQSSTQLPPRSSAQFRFDRGYMALMLGRYSEAQTCFSATMAERLKLHADRRDVSGYTWHQDVAEVLRGQGHLATWLGDTGAAEASLAEAYTIYATTLGELSLEVGETLEHLGEAALQSGRLPEAEQRLELAACNFQRVFANKNANQLLRTALRQARLALLRRELELARTKVDDVLRGCVERGTPTHPLALWAALLSAEIQRQQGFSQAVALQAPALLGQLRRCFPGHPMFARIHPDVALNPLRILF